MTSSLFTRQNLGVFSSFLPSITQAITQTPVSQRAQVGRYALLNLKDDPVFPSDGLCKKIYYCVCLPLASGEFSVYVAAGAKKGSAEFEKEKKALDLLRGVVLVLQPLFIGEHDSYEYMISELCNQGDLYSFILNPKRDLRSFETHWAGYLLVEAVKECHDRGIVLRDLKPENVLVMQRPNGTITIRLIDFGFSFILGEDSEAEAAKACGSLGYLSPEDYADIRVGKTPYPTFSRDFWPLGSTLYSLATRNMLASPVLNARGELARVIYGEEPQSSLGMFDREIRNLTYAKKSEQMGLALILENMSKILFRFFPREASKALNGSDFYPFEVDEEAALNEYLLPSKENLEIPKTQSIWKRLCCCLY